MGAPRSICLAFALTVACSLLAAPAASASDSMATPTPLANSVPQQADTSAYTVEPGEQNTTAPFENQCGSGHNVGLARTAWYTIQGSGGQVTVTTKDSSFDTSLYAYTGSPAGTAISCDDDSGGGVASSITFATTAGTTYAIQAGTACNEIAPCTPAPAGGALNIVSIEVAPNQDLDGDGVIGSQFAGPDCDDANPAIHPGATDIPRDGIDQDCSGADASLATVGAKSAMSVLFFRTFTRVKKLTVSDVPAGSKVVVTCATKKRGCPFKRKTIAVAKPRKVSLTKLLKRAKLRKRAVVTVRVTKPGFIGTVDRYTFRIGKLPTKRTLCLQPGSKKPRKKCS